MRIDKVIIERVYSNTFLWVFSDRKAYSCRLRASKLIIAGLGLTWAYIESVFTLQAEGQYLMDRHLTLPPP